MTQRTFFVFEALLFVTTILALSQLAQSEGKTEEPQNSFYRENVNSPSLNFPICEKKFDLGLLKTNHATSFNSFGWVQPHGISSIVLDGQFADPGWKLEDATAKRVSVLNIGRQSE